MDVLVYTVTIRVSESMDKKAIGDIGNSILDGLIHTANTIGIVPDNIDGFVETISVTNSDGISVDYDMIKGEGFEN